MPLVARPMSPSSSWPGFAIAGVSATTVLGEVAVGDGVERLLQRGGVVALEQVQAVEHLARRRGGCRG